MQTLPVRRAAGVLALLACACVSRATLIDYQNAVTGAGTAPAATRFVTVSGAAPEMFNVGALSGDRTFEFIVNAGSGGASSALLGSRPNGAQGLKFEQWQDTLKIGMTDFGVVDLTSNVASPVGVDTHIAFTSDGRTDTDLYVNGVFRESFPTVLRMTGLQGLAAAANADGTFFDVLDGAILSFASYNSALSPGEIADHAAAFAIPEPASTGLLALGALGLLARHRRRGA